MKKQLILLTILSFIISNSFAQTHTWTGNGDNYFWSDPDNWDQGTVPLTNGTGTVIIPEGVEVHSTSSINFEYGEFKGGGTFINNGELNLINSDEVLTSKVISNITIISSAAIKTFRAEGISNTDPILLNEGAVIIKYGQNTSGTELTLDGIGFSFNTQLPGVIEVYGAIIKTGPEDVLIDVEMINIFYNINVLEGLLVLDPFTNNIFKSTDFLISEGASLILKGNNIFDGSAGGIGGNIEGTLEITNDGASGNPSVYESVSFNAEGEITLNNVTFQGDGTLHLFTETIIPESSIVTFDESTCYNRSTFKTSPQSEIILKNNGELKNGHWSNMDLNGGSITGLNNESFKNFGDITIIENSTININGVHLFNAETINLQNGSLIMDDNTNYEGYYQEIINPYGELIDIEYSEILGSGNIKFPANNSQNTNNGYLIPDPGVEEINTENYAQTEIGYLQIDIESLTNFDKIINTGTTYFEGNIEVILGYSPTIGDEFMIYQSNIPLDNCNPVSTTSAVYNNFNYVFDVICNTDNITLILSEILATNNFELNDYSFYNYPNPMSNETTFNFSALEDLTQDSSIKIYNYLGQLVREITIKNSGNIIFKRENLSSGIYFATLKSNNKTLAITKLILD